LTNNDELFSGNTKIPLGSTEPAGGRSDVIANAAAIVFAETVIGVGNVAAAFTRPSSSPRQRNFGRSR
jgi:hypothetical protein